MNPDDINVSSAGSYVIKKEDIGDTDKFRRDVLPELDDRLFLINPHPAIVSTAVSHVYESEIVSIRVYAEEKQVCGLVEGFSFATIAADLMEQDRLEIRVTGRPPRNSFIHDNTVAIVIVDIGEALVHLTVGSDVVSESLFTAYLERWNDAEEFNIDAPSLTQIRTSLTETFGDAVLHDFDTVYPRLAQRDFTSRDVVPVFLLLAAKHEELYYDISTWGDEIGIASRGIFSQFKHDLEESGVLDSEKVITGVGRPKHRLLLTDDELLDASGEAFLSHIEGIIR